jgi:Xaa-Pro aminopeptidase
MQHHRRTAVLTTLIGLLLAGAAAPVQSSGGFESSVVPDPPIPVETLKQRRAALLDLLEPGIAFLRSADPRGSYEHAQDSDFRQNNDFYYLTGLESPGSWLVLFKGANGSGKSMLYVPEPDSRQEVWTGRRVGEAAEVAEQTGIDAVRSASRFDAEVLAQLRQPQGLGEYGHIYLPLGDRGEEIKDLAETSMQARLTISDLGTAMAQLRLVKDSVEVERLRRAISITAEAQKEAMRSVEPGMYEYELEAIVEYVVRSGGAERVGFPTIVGSGPNSVILHYDRNRRRTEKSDLIVIDAGAEYGYYTADVTRTFPASGKFSPRQREIYELVLAVQTTVIDSIRPGRAVFELEMIARRYMREHSKGMCGSATCDRYFLHGLSHWLGMNVHDVGSYKTSLEPGMVLTVEPGIYLAHEDIGVRIEDDVLVTEDGHEVLSAAAPKTVEAIESLMAEDSRLCESRR